MDKIAEALVGTLKAQAEQFADGLKVDAGELKLYIAERLVILARAAMEPGFERVVRAERTNILLKGGLLTVGKADEADKRLSDIMYGALGTAVRIGLGGV